MQRVTSSSSSHKTRTKQNRDPVGPNSHTKARAHPFLRTIIHHLRITVGVAHAARDRAIWPPMRPTYFRVIQMAASDARPKPERVQRAHMWLWPWSIRSWREHQPSVGIIYNKYPTKLASAERERAESSRLDLHPAHICARAIFSLASKLIAS
jgi:hypothetical protein